jgi:oligosaccharide reducing-end xylanase
MKKHSLSLVLALGAVAVLFSNTTLAQSDIPCPADNASYNTGVYYNAFLAAGLGTQAQIDTKVNAIWSQLFSETDTNRILYTADTSKSFVKAIDSNDIRSEGVSYGMMIAVQLDQQAVFDKLWNFALTYELRKEGTVNDHFAWNLKPDAPYTANDAGPASDGEIYFAAALIFAQSRWGSGGLSSTDANYKNYNYWAKEVLRMLEAKFFRNFTTPPFMDGPLVRFVPGADFSDPSYHLPVFFEMFAVFQGKTAKTDFWRKAANVSRSYLVTATLHPSGLTTDYAKWDGTPQPMAGSGTMNEYADKFAYDSWRVIHNIAMDVAFCTMDSYGAALPWKQLQFWTSQGGTWDSSQKKWSAPYRDRYNLATNMVIGSDHSPGHVGMNGSGAALFYGNNATSTALAKPFIEELWNQATPTGTYRYYGGLLHTFGFLRTAGRYKLYKTTALPNMISGMTADTDQSSLKDVQPSITVKNITAGALTNFKARYFLTTAEGKTPVLTDISTPNSNPTLEQLDNRTWQVTLDYSGKTLAPGASMPASGNGETFRIAYSDNSNFDKDDDYSYPYSGSTPTATTRVAVYDGAGNLAMGAPPRGKLPSYSAAVKSTWSNMMLTLTGAANDSETRAQPLTAAWNTQTWVVEPVPETGFVRLKNTSNGRYLNVQNDAENAKVVAYDRDLNWRSEMWSVESVSGGGVRLKNYWSGRYLTVVDSGQYSQVLSKALVESWPSQIWSIQ